MKKILLAIVLLFCSFSAEAQTDLKKIRIQDFSGGMVSNSIPDLLQPNQAASMLNVSLNKSGKLTKRKGHALFNVDVSNVAHRGLGRFDPDNATSYIVIASETSIARSTAAATFWTLANPTSSPQTIDKDTAFVQANDLLFVLNGYDSTAWYNGSTWIKSTVYPSSPPTATTGAWLRNYLFLAGATSEQDWLYFSNNLSPTVFSASDIIKINTGDGQKIQRILPFRLNELIIYKERSVFVLDITGSTPLADWTVQPISTVIGTIAPRSVVSLGNDHWFLSSEPIAIRSLARTEFDKILVDYISKPIQDIFDGTNEFGYSINKEQIEKAAAVLFDNKYLLAVPINDSTVNNLVIVYDFLNKAWYLITGWEVADWVVFDNRLFYADARDGKVLEAFSGTTGDYIAGPANVNSSNPTIGINFQYVSRALDFDNAENFKRIDALEVEFYPTGNYDARVEVNLDYKGWASAGTVNLGGRSTILPITLPTTLSNAGMARKTFQLQSQGEFKKMQFKVQNSASLQSVELQRVSVFSQEKPWRREP